MPWNTRVLCCFHRHSPALLPGCYRSARFAVVRTVRSDRSERLDYTVVIGAMRTAPLIRPAATFSPCGARREGEPTFFLLHIRGTGRRRADAFPSPRLRGEGGAQRRMRGRGHCDASRRAPLIRPSATFSPCGARGEGKHSSFPSPALGTKRRKAARRMCFSFSPPAGRRWRAATDEGRPTEHGLTMSACSQTPRPSPINC